MTVDADRAAGQAALFETMGQRPLATDAGLDALGEALALREPQVAVVAGDGPRIRAYFAAARREHLCLRWR